MMWRTTAKLSAAQVISWGLLYYTFAVCLPFMEADLGWTSTQLSAGFSTALFVSGVSAPLVGYLANRHGTQVLMTSGSITGVVGLVVWGWSPNFFTYIVAWILIGLAMATTLYEMAFATVVRAYPKSHRQPIVVITLVGALASTLFMPLASVAFVELGWRSGVTLLAVVLGVTVIPLYWTLPTTTKETDEGTKATMASGSRVLWVLAIAFAFESVVKVAVSTYAVTFLIEKGYGVSVAASIVGTAGIAKLFGRIATSVEKWVSATTMLRGSLFLQAAALLTPTISSSTTSLILMMVIFGATSGAYTVLRPLLIVERLGGENFAANSGLLSGFSTLAKAATPVGIGATVGVLGIDGAWIVLPVLALTSGVILFLLPATQHASQAIGRCS